MEWWWIISLHKNFSIRMASTSSAIGWFIISSLWLRQAQPPSGKFFIDYFLKIFIVSCPGFVNFVRRPSVCAQPPVYLLFLLFGFDRLSHRVENFLLIIFWRFSLSPVLASWTSFADLQSVLSHRFIYYFSLKIFLSPTLKGGKILTSINKMSSL